MPGQRVESFVSAVGQGGQPAQGLAYRLGVQPVGDSAPIRITGDDQVGCRQLSEVLGYRLTAAAPAR
jgi:hypothetical protein